ncbi:hypothetical protein QNO08_04680 [Arthrobacter sp. zg-Y820]|uniref:hypothetical protein n=1 Tax=unclassified Arthrobacter TaxID=235627 RepID=UPI001E52309C|nr:MULTISPECIES: hypothetical protein [unclassified Arthrobacter]MCC9198007.1 hypothetical protein [Arthrobacter sp. zg-Y820]MDK1280874.1 hypothetical protein [Arthrobacter sp. zg.Y820]WIB10353.1 hypothetical protein QNO08_04680 [Arthrobacter sp. zg-Y820]
MGLFGGKRAARDKAAAEVDAWVAGAAAALPGAEVSADSWTGPFFMSGLAANTYTVRTLGSRSQLSAVISRLSHQIDALGPNDTLNLQIAGSEAPGAGHSRLAVSGEKRDREWLQVLVRTHDSLIARLPDQSVLMGGLNGRCTVLGVAREDALSIGRLLISWWEEQQMGEAGSSPLSGLSLEIGGRHDDPEITYTVDPSGSFDAEGVELDEPAEPLSAVEKRERIRLAVAAWTGSLADLDTAARLDLRPGYAIEFQFLLPGFDPHLLVIELATGVWNKEETARTEEAIRSRNPAPAVRTP